MDMKKILAAFDSAGSKPVTGTNDMKRFVSIIKENSAPSTAVNEKILIDPDGKPVPGQSRYHMFQPNWKDDQRPTQISPLTPGRNINGLTKSEWIKKVEAAGGKLDLVARSLNGPVTATLNGKKIKWEVVKSPQPPVADNKLKVGQMVKFGIWNKSQEHRVGKIVSISNSGLEVIVDVDGEQIKLNRANKSLIIQPVKDNQDVGEGAAEDLDAIEKHPAADDNRIQKAISDKKKELGISKEGIHNGLTFKDYFALEEAKKKITAKEDPCWKGYKMVGTKKKGGREVPNCVPGKKGD